MELYIIDKHTLKTLSMCNISNYNINLDEETNGVSEFTVLNIDSARKGNYIIINGLYKQFLFVVNDDVVAIKGEQAITISALDISNIFDRKIILKNTDIMTTRGIEQFIADNILDNFVNIEDELFSLDYIDIYTHTNTIGTVTIDDDNGLYNFHTFITNCRQAKNVYTEFSIVYVNNQKRLRIDIERKEESTKLIDTTIAEVTQYKKIYEVDPVTKVEAYIREDESLYTLYLRADRTTTTNKNDPERIYGRIETISCDTLDRAKEEALNVIRANSYKHLVEFSIAKTSQLIDVNELNIGRPIRIKTDDSIYDSYISAISLTDENFVNFKSGNLRIDFTDKQRQLKKSGSFGSKVDISGGIIYGNLHVKKNVNSAQISFEGYNTGNIYWKESGWGDQFRIIPAFGGADDNNKLKFQGSVGGAGEIPSLYDLLTISAKNGNVETKGNIIANGNFIANKSEINYNSWHNVVLYRSDGNKIYMMLYGSTTLKPGTYSIKTDFSIYCYNFSGNNNGKITIPKGAISGIVRYDWGFELYIDRTKVQNINSGDYNGMGIVIDSTLTLVSA